MPPSAPLVHRPVAALLRVPLAVKLAGANALVVLVAAAAVASAAQPDGSRLRLVEVLAAALLAGVVVNVLLVRAALRPLRELEHAAARVVGGDLTARVAPSPLADAEMARVGTALNAALDALGAERARVRALAAEAIREADADRARVARELHDSAAQTLAALTLTAGSAARRLEGGGDPALAEQLHLLRDLSEGALEELRALSLTVHPRVLDDLGLAAALRELAARPAGPRDARVEVEVHGDAARLEPAAAAALYSMAQEAVANAVAHGDARRIRLRLAVTGGAARLDVDDDGRGFTAPPAGTGRPPMGLFVMRERAALLDGRVRVESAPGRGTRVSAELPLGGARPANVPHPETA